MTLLSLLGCGEVTDPKPDGGAEAGSNASAAGRGSSAGHAGAAGTSGSVAADGGATTAGNAALDAGVRKDAAPPEDDDAGMPVPPSPLCDGSENMRLAYQAGGGFVDQTYFFTNPYGHAFFVVDGMCRYYAGSNFMRGIATGTLSKADADALSADVHWNELAGWSWPVGKDQSCPDAGGVSLLREKATAGCSCGCDEAAPKGLEEALGKASDWSQRLLDQGKPLDGAVSAIAFPSASGSSPTAPVVPWPLSRSMSSIDGLVHDRNDPSLQSTMPKLARFDDATEASKLREARAATRSHDTATRQSYWVPLEENSTRYDLYVRDDLPDAAVKAWKALSATIPQTP